MQSIRNLQEIEEIIPRQIKISTRLSNRITEYEPASNYLVKQCLKNNIGNVLIGELTGIKQKSIKADVITKILYRFHLVHSKVN